MFPTIYRLSNETDCLKMKKQILNWKMNKWIDKINNFYLISIHKVYNYNYNYIYVQYCNFYTITCNK